MTSMILLYTIENTDKQTDIPVVFAFNTVCNCVFTGIAFPETGISLKG